MSQKKFVEPDKISVGEWLIIYIEDFAKQRIRQRSYERLQSLYKHLAPLHDQSIQKLTNHAIQRNMNDLAVVFSAQTVKHVKNLLHAALIQAIISNIITSNPAENLSLPKIKRKEITVFTRDELAAIQKASDGHRWQMIITIATMTGMRLGEILGLRRCDFDHAKASISVVQTLQAAKGGLIFEPPKTAAGRRKITIPRPTADELLKYINHNPGELIFTSEIGTPITPSNFERWYIKLLEKAEVPHRGFHSLRHTHITRLINAGNPITAVTRRAGHSKISITLDVYSHAIPSDEQLLTDSVENLFIK